MSAVISNQTLQPTIHPSEPHDLSFDSEKLLTNHAGQGAEFAKLKHAIVKGDEVAMDCLLNLCAHQLKSISSNANDLLVSLYKDDTLDLNNQIALGEKAIVLYEYYESNKDQANSLVIGEKVNPELGVLLVAAKEARSQHLDGLSAKLEPSLHLPFSDIGLNDDPLNSQRYITSTELEAYLSQHPAQCVKVMDPIGIDDSERLQKTLDSIERSGEGVVIIPTLQDQHWSAILIELNGFKAYHFNSNSHGGEGAMALPENEHNIEFESMEHECLQHPHAYQGGSAAINGCGAFVVDMIKHIDQQISKNTSLNLGELLQHYYKERAAKPERTESSIDGTRMALLYEGLKAEHALLT